MPFSHHFKVIKGGENLTKRVLPRFPYSYLNFRFDNGEENTFEVKDISHTGMQVALRDGLHSLDNGKTVEGELHWKGDKVNVKGVVKWVTGSRAGIAFETAGKDLISFLDVKKAASHLQPIHKLPMDIELPTNLKYWLSADGPVEIFMWKHNDGEVSQFDIIFFEHYVEWVDGRGRRTGRILTKRDIDSPLLTEDEFVFKPDEELDTEKLAQAQSLVDSVNVDHLTEGVIEFLHRKLEKH